MGTPHATSSGLSALDTPTVRRMAAANATSFLLGALPMARWERRLRSTGGPGILGLELARDAGAVRSILTTWGPDGRQAAREQTWADFAWMLTYGITGVCLAELARRSAPPDSGWDRVGRTVRWAPAAAVACDVVEGFGMLRTLSVWPRVEEPAVQITRAAAVSKFAFLGVTAAWAVGAVAAGRRGR